MNFVAKGKDPQGHENHFLRENGITNRKMFRGGYITPLGNHYETTTGEKRVYHRFSQSSFKIVAEGETEKDMFYYLIRLQASSNLGYIRNTSKVLSVPEIIPDPKYPESGIVIVGTRQPGLLTIDPSIPSAGVTNLILYRNALFVADSGRMSQYLKMTQKNFCALFEQQVQKIEDKECAAHA